jgi:hypothetical protein
MKPMDADAYDMMTVPYEDTQDGFKVDANESPAFHPQEVIQIMNENQRQYQ